MEKGANGQSCLTEIEFDIGAATACVNCFHFDLVHSWLGLHYTNFVKLI